jgi:hypothetical protein
MDPKAENKDHAEKGREAEWKHREGRREHDVILCCCIPDTRAWKKRAGIQARERRRPSRKSHFHDGEVRLSCQNIPGTWLEGQGS